MLTGARTGKNPYQRAPPVGGRNVPQLRDRKGHIRTRLEAAARAAPDAGRPLGRSPDPRKVRNPVGDPARDPLKPVCHRGDRVGHQRRPRWGSLGFLGDFAEEPDERRHRGRGDQPHPDLLRWSVGPDRWRRRDLRRDSRGGETLPPVVPARVSRPIRSHTRLRPEELLPLFVRPNVVEPRPTRELILTAVNGSGNDMARGGPSPARYDPKLPSRKVRRRTRREAAP